MLTGNVHHDIKKDDELKTDEVHITELLIDDKENWAGR